MNEYRTALAQFSSALTPLKTPEIMKTEFVSLYQVCEEPAPFGIKIGTSVENGLSGKKGHFALRLFSVLYKTILNLFK